jgi:hypothetical protein
MRAIPVSVAAALILAVHVAPAATGADNPAVRKNNDAGASSTVIRKDEPPLTAMPTPRDGDKSMNRQNQ